MARAQGVRSRLAVLTHASRHPKRAAQDLYEFFEATGFPSLGIFFPGKPLVLDEMTAVYISGGSRTRLLSQLTADEKAALKQFYTAGGVIGACGAAAAMAGELVITAGIEDGILRSRSLKTEPGLALAPGLIVEPKLQAGARIPRLITALAEQTDAKLALGLDDDTGLILGGPSHGLVVGQGHAWFLSRTRAHRNNLRNMLDIYPATASGIKLSTLGGGQKFNFRRSAWQPPQ